MNARFDDAFQLEMMAAAADADALVCFNRLWDDAARRGVRRLGPERAQPARAAGGADRRGPEGVSPAGGHGRTSARAVACSTTRGRAAKASQLHTFFQLPLREYPATAGSRTERALHALLFHPADGLVAGMLELERAGVLHRRGGELRFLDLCGPES